MAEEMTFLPRNQVLSLEELYIVAKGLVQAGIKKIRLTGGEPLVRKNVLWLVEKIGQIDGLEELTLTTNGSQLPLHAKQLRDAGVSRVNISIDSLKPEKFKQITRTGSLDRVLDGIDAAIEAGFDQIKLNSVILKHRNDNEVLDLVDYAISKALDIAFIEEMPLGEIIEHDRAIAYCSSDEIKSLIKRKYQLEASSKKTNGPSRYFTIKPLEDQASTSIASQIGFISPHSNNFCGDCNRIRVTVEGRVLFCLGNEHSVDLRAPLRACNNETTVGIAEQSRIVSQTIQNNLHLKPEKHHFDLEAKPDIVRFMNMSGG